MTHNHVAAVRYRPRELVIHPRNGVNKELAKKDEHRVHEPYACQLARRWACIRGCDRTVGTR